MFDYCPLQQRFLYQALALAAVSVGLAASAFNAVWSRSSGGRKAEKSRRKPYKKSRRKTRRGGKFRRGRRC